MPLPTTTTPDESQAGTVTETIVTSKTATVYTDVNLTSTQFEMDGYAWPVSAYFSQVLSADDSPRRLDVHLSPTLQQYIRINNFVILTDGDPSPSTDSQVITTMEGQGKIYPSLVPNAGDMFIATLRDGRSGLFVVTHVERTQSFSASVWDITYQLVDYLNQIYQDNLDIKVIKDLYFDEETKRCDDGLKTVVSKQAISDHIAMLVNRWWDEFYDLKTGVCVVKINDARYYDHMINRFMLEIVPYDLYRTLPSIQEFTIPASQYAKRYNTLWDIMAYGEFSQFDYISRHVLLMNRTEFLSGNVYTGIGYNQIEGIIHPSLQPSLFSANAVDMSNIQYIFTKAFYDKETTKMAPIETLVYRAISGEVNTYDDIIAVVKTVLADKTPEKRFYSLPILVWLLIRLT